MTRPRLREVRVRGFKSLRDVTFEPRPVTVLIGPNGSGKSNLLALFRMVEALRDGTFQRFVAAQGGAASILHGGPRRTPRARLSLGWDAPKLHYAVDLDAAGGGGLVVGGERASDPGGDLAHAVSGPESDLDGGMSTPTAHFVREALGAIRTWHVHDTSPNAALRQVARGSDDRQLAPDAGNLAAFLHRLRTSREPDDQAAWARIVGLVRSVAPMVRELVPTPLVPGQDPPQSVRLDWIDEAGDRYGVHDLSDGTLRAIALFTALGQPLQTLPGFITIDEPELGLHPHALGLFAGLVRSVSSHAQVVLATHSPLLLDQFDVDDIVVVGRQDGASTLRRLDRESLRSWLADYTISELFLKNVLEGLG